MRSNKYHNFLAIEGSVGGVGKRTRREVSKRFLMTTTLQSKRIMASLFSEFSLDTLAAGHNHQWLAKRKLQEST